MAFVWQDKENGVDDIFAEHINDVAHEVIRLEEDKANNDLSNVDDNVFKNKAVSAGIEGKVLSVNGKEGKVTLIPSDIGACTTDEVTELINSSHSAVVFPRFNKIESDIDNINNQIAEKVDKAQEIFEEELDTIILTDSQPKLFKVSKTLTGMISAFNPYYAYWGEVPPLVDGQATSLYQYKITSDGIYFRTGTRQPTGSEQVWTSWVAIGNSSIDTDKYEQVSNKVTVIDETATDTQYPTAKAVWEIVGSISDVMDNIIALQNHYIEGGLPT